MTVRMNFWYGIAIRFGQRRVQIGLCQLVEETGAERNITQVLGRLHMGKYLPKDLVWQCAERHRETSCEPIGQSENCDEYWSDSGQRAPRDFETGRGLS
jgi:hypothetical protein